METLITLLMAGAKKLPLLLLRRLAEPMAPVVLGIRAALLLTRRLPREPTPLLQTTTREASTRRSKPLGATSSTWRRSWERSAVTNGTGPE